MPLQNILRIFQSIKKLRCAQDYWPSSSSLPNTVKLTQTMWELWPTKDFGFRGDYYITKKLRFVSLARNTPICPPPFLPNIMTLCLRVSKLWRAKGCISDFYFRGYNYITKKEIVSLARDTTTGPSLHPYQILSNYLKQYESYGLHKILASGEKKLLRFVSLACDIPTGTPLYSYQILSKHV